jgi:DNA primase
MDFVDQLKSQLDIVDVVGHYVRLKRNGSSPRLVGLCPFHTEKTPSFGVHRVHQFYKCFGCSAGGDFIKFVMEIEGLSFFETLKLLSERYGIPMPQRQQDDPAAQKREALFEMHEIAARTFEDNLHSAAGAEAQSYLRQRGLTLDTIREFRLGLSDARGQQLVQRLQKFGPALMEESKLVAKRQEGTGYYDFFRNRLMFPIHNESGKVIAFGGRALAPDEKVKYVNSAETPIYTKGLVLYNLHRAKAQARKLDRIILVEGYMDVIGVSQAGIQNVVALCGTALKSDQVRSIKRQIAQTDVSAGHVIVNLDPDPAGARGTQKSIELLLAEGLRVKILTIPGDLDPDEFIQTHGTERYLQLAQSAPSYFHWQIDRAKEKFDISSTEGKVSALQSLWPTLQKVHDRFERNMLIEDLAGRLGVEVQLIRDQFRQLSPNQESIKRVVEISSSIPPNERLLLAAVLHTEEARMAVLHYLEQSGVPGSLQLKNVFAAMLGMQRSGFAFSLGALLDRLEEREQRIVTELGFQHWEAGPEAAAAQVLHCLQALEKKNIEDRRTDLKRQIRAADLAGNLQEALRLNGLLKVMEQHVQDMRRNDANPAS